ncbi:hypothetical protein Bca52824_082901 [Brassica carinata]|uniref:Uncharacterized protein n=1 Tax=Brassica carinata TaxID=52824 RepID=A0A8X7TSC7_BRACI|nr:hypothetical protein Bca52824_082901 [Brassica carinata]
MLLGLREHEDPKTGVRTAAQMSVFNNSGIVELVRGFATCKKLKLSGSQGMYVVFAKDDQGSGLDFDQWFQGSGTNRKLQRSVQREEALIRFGTRQGVGTLRLQVEAEVSMVIIKWMVVIEVIGLHGFEEMVVIGRASGLRSIEVEQLKLNRWMKSDELYSEYVRLRRSVLRRLQEMQKVSMYFALASRSFEATLRILGVVKH